MEHYLEWDSTRNNAHSSVLLQQMKPAIWCKNWSLLSKLFFISITIQFHILLLMLSKHFRNSFESWNHTFRLTICMILSESPYGVIRVAANQNVKDAVLMWLRGQPITFFSEGICKLVEHWTKCILNQGIYIEK